MNVTFYKDNIDAAVPGMQKKVFHALGLDIIQVKSTDWKSHGGEIDNFLRYTAHDIYTLWDVDCIPMNAQIVQLAEQQAKRGIIFGAAQRASHIPGSDLYASPAFMSFTRETWTKLGKPSFSATSRADCAGEITYLANEKGIEVKLIFPSHVEVPKWLLVGDQMFGLGTTYGDAIYHAFMIRKGNNEMFIRKCNEVLKKAAA